MIGGIRIRRLHTKIGVKDLPELRTFRFFIFIAGKFRHVLKKQIRDGTDLSVTELLLFQSTL